MSSPAKMSAKEFIQEVLRIEATYLTHQETLLISKLGMLRFKREEMEKLIDKLGKLKIEMGFTVWGLSTTESSSDSSEDSDIIPPPKKKRETFLIQKNEEPVKEESPKKVEEPKKEETNDEEHVYLHIEEEDTSSDYSTIDSSSSEESEKEFNIVKQHRKTIFKKIHKELNNLEQGLYYKLWVLWDKIERGISALTFVCSFSLVSRLEAFLHTLHQPVDSILSLQDTVAMTYQFFTLASDDVIKENENHREIVEPILAQFNEFYNIVCRAYDLQKQKKAQDKK